MMQINEDQDESLFFECWYHTLTDQEDQGEVETNVKPHSVKKRAFVENETLFQKETEIFKGF
jgi:hypothetical protein